MRIVVIVLGVLAALVLLVVIVGWLQPVRHRVSRQAAFALPPDSVYAVIADIDQYPAWRSKLKSVELVANDSVLRSYREVSADGVILYVVEEAVPGRRYVTRIADTSLPFGGTWTFELTPTATGTTLRITEDGEVYNPVFRFVSRFILSHHATIDTYLTDLGRRLGSTVVIGE